MGYEGSSGDFSDFDCDSEELDCPNSSNFVSDSFADVESTKSIKKVKGDATPTEQPLDYDHESETESEQNVILHRQLPTFIIFAGQKQAFYVFIAHNILNHVLMQQHSENISMTSSLCLMTVQVYS